MRKSVPWRGSGARGATVGLSSRRTAFWLAGVLLLCFIYFLPRWHSYNEDARIDVVLSVVNHGTINIDAYGENTGDEDEFQGHYYSNKAVGQSLVGVPVYAAFKLAASWAPFRSFVNGIEGDHVWRSALVDAGCIHDIPKDPCRFVLTPELDFALLQYMESILTVAIPSVLMLLLFFWFLGLFSESLFNRALLTLGVGLGTIVFPYSQLYFSHVPATALDFLGFVLIYCVRRSHQGDPVGLAWLGSHKNAALLVAGFALGLSIVFEYPAAIPVGLIGLYALWQLPKPMLCPIIVGALPGLAIIMGYDYAAYHDPFTTGYGCNEVHFTGECRGIAGFVWPPDPSAIRDLSVGEYRGLLFISPFLLLAFPGYLLWSMVRRDRPTQLLFLAIPVVFFFAICMYWGWNGGQVAGPRYLMELVPFLAFPVIFVLDHVRDVRARAAIVGLFILSGAAVWTETIGGKAFARGPVRNPLFDYNLPQLLDGHLPLSLGRFLGVAGGLSILPLVGGVAIWSAAILFTRARAQVPARVVKPA